MSEIRDIVRSHSDRGIGLDKAAWLSSQTERKDEHMDIKKIVKDNTARFSFYRTGNAFYNVTVDGVEYAFPVSLEDIGGATLNSTEKAITLMRYIRKALDGGTFVKAS